MRHLILILGDQLNPDASAFDDFSIDDDAVLMAEVVEESTHVWSSKARIAVFLAGMRHFREDLISRGIRVRYHELDDSAGFFTLSEALILEPAQSHSIFVPIVLFLPK